MADLFLKISCTYCQEEVGDISIQCCECEDFDICLECFSAGAEIGTHKRDHSYKIRDTCASKVLLETVSKWTASEQYMLLNGMEYYRYGSWEKISEHVKTRLPQEVKDEYDRVFVQGTIGIMTWSTPEVTSLRPKYTIDLETAMEAIVSPAISKLHPMIATAEEMEKLGYSPFRDEYKLEYNPDVEQMIPLLMPFSSEDTNFEKIFKILVIDVIYRRLIDRIRRKRFVRDYQLITKFFKTLDKNEKQIPADDYDILNQKFQVFSRLQTANEYDNFLNAVINFEKLKTRRQQIIQYQKKGFRTRDEVIHHEQHILYHLQESNAVKPCSMTHLRYFASVWKERKRREEFGFNPKNFTEQIFSSSVVTDDNVKAMPAHDSLNRFELLLCKLFGLKPLQFIELKLLVVQDLFNQKFDRNVQNNKFTAVIVDKTLKDVVSDYINHVMNVNGINFPNFHH